MEDNPTQSRETSDIEEPGREANENHYELDLEEHAPEDIDAAFQDAVEAVDRAQDEAPDASPAAKRPLTVVICSWPHAYSGGAISLGPATQAPEAPEWEPMK